MPLLRLISEKKPKSCCNFVSPPLANTPSGLSEVPTTSVSKPKMLQPIFTNSLKLVSLPVDRLIDVPLYCYDFIGLCSSSLCLEYISKINIKMVISLLFQIKKNAHLYEVSIYVTN